MIQKFRAWHKIEKKMLDVDTISFEDGYGREKLSARLVDKYSALFYDVPEDALLMQSTGLKDKNGKEIFEGDIVEIDDRECDIDKIFLVKFVGWNGFYLKGETQGLPQIRSWNMEGNESNTQVIGNIYENPELLGGASRGQD